LSRKATIDAISSVACASLQEIEFYEPTMLQ
jgi:hypothetical protein